MHRALAILAVALLGAGCLDPDASDRAGHDDDQPSITYETGPVELDVGGFTMLADIQGQHVPGQPTVVFDAGAESVHTDWQVTGVQQAIASQALTISYDRAGLGGSEENGLPKTGDVQAKQLRLLLEAAHLPPPYLLVSHSIAGLNARIFNDLFEDEVAGIVFVDSSHERQNEGHWQAIMIASFAAGAEMSYDEFEETVRVVKEGRAEDRLREKPIAVLSATCHLACESGVEEPTEPDWQEFQRDLAGLSNHAVHRIADPGVGHQIMADDPDMVIDAVLMIVEAAGQAELGS